MSVTDPIIIPIEGDPSDFIKDSSKVNAELDKMAGSVKRAGSTTVQSMRPAAVSITDLRSSYMIAMDAARMAGQVWQATGQQFVNYAEQVKNMSRNIGASAEETSRLIQVSDDVRISYESLGTAMKFANKNGIEVSTENIAKLSDQYLALAPGVERTKFLLDKFGKSGMEMGKLLDKGGDSIRSMSASISDNLIMTDKGIKASDEYQKSLDELKDSAYGVQVAVGSQLTPVMNAFMKVVLSDIQAVGVFKDVLTGDKSLAEAAREVADIINSNGFEIWGMQIGDVAEETEALTQSQEDNTDASSTQAEAIKQAEAALKNYKDALDQVSKANMDMESMSRTIANDQKEYAQSHAEAIAALAEATKEGSTEGIAEAQKAVQDLEATWHESANNMIYDMVLVGLSAGGLLDSEQKALDEYAVKAGIKTQADIDEANRRKEIADSTIAGILQSEDVLAEQRKIDAETLRLQEAVTAGQVMDSAAKEAAAMSNVTLAIDSATRSLMAMGAAAGSTASAVGKIKVGGGSFLPTGMSKVAADPRRGRGSGTKYALGGEFMIPMQYGYEGFSLGGMATASGGETVTVTPKGEGKGSTIYNIYITNPKREAAEGSIKSALRNLVYTGSAT